VRFIAIAAGRYEIVTQYFDLNIGKAKFPLYIRNRSGGRLLDEWTADDDLPSARIGGDTSTRYRTFAISLAPQYEIRVEGLPDSPTPPPSSFRACLLQAGAARNLSCSGSRGRHGLNIHYF